MTTEIFQEAKAQLTQENLLRDQLLPLRKSFQKVLESEGTELGHHYTLFKLESRLNHPFTRLVLGKKFVDAVRKEVSLKSLQAKIIHEGEEYEIEVFESLNSAITVKVVGSSSRLVLQENLTESKVYEGKRALRTPTEEDIEQYTVVLKELEESFKTRFV